jgi:hypothetical protein
LRLERNWIVISRFPLALCALLFISLSVFAQEEAGVLDPSRIPAEGRASKEFVPAGWKIEEQVAGDLNGDSLPDFALKLVEDKVEKTSEGYPTERGRALVIVLATADGKLKRAGVAEALLQCTRCGGAFYGVVEAPADVKIEKGSVVVNQEHGSRELSNITFRFRYDSATQRFVLTGFDYATADRLTANTVTESINYLTGMRVVQRGKGNRDTTSKTTVPKKKIFLENVDASKFEEAANKRLGL